MEIIISKIYLVFDDNLLETEVLRIKILIFSINYIGGSVQGLGPIIGRGRRRAGHEVLGALFYNLSTLHCCQISSVFSLWRSFRGG